MQNKILIDFLLRHVNVSQDELNGENHVSFFLYSMENVSTLWSVDVTYELIVCNLDSSKQLNHTVSCMVRFRIKFSDFTGHTHVQA